MLLTHDLHEDVQIITLDGNLTYQCAPQLRKQLSQIIESTTPFLILNVEKVRYADARGVSIFITAANLAKNYHGELVLLDVVPALRTIVELTRLHYEIRIFTDKLAALEDLQQAYRLYSATKKFSNNA